jgi:hypothetical protein
MNNRTNRWAVQVTPKLSEAVQRIAFSYGYKWHAGPAEVRYTEYPFLTFHPDTKTFGFVSENDIVKDHVSRVVTTFEDVIDLFNNPPESPLVMEGTVILRNGDVKPHALVLAAEHFDKVVKARDELLARNRKKLPIVKFVYTSQTSTKKERKVAVTKFEPRMFIEGYDLDDRNRYKRFLMDRINGFVAFDGFVDNP